MMWKVNDTVERSIKKIDHRKKTFRFYDVYFVPGGWTPHMRGGDARRKFRIEPLKETDLGVAQAFFDP